MDAACSCVVSGWDGFKGFINPREQWKCVPEHCGWTLCWTSPSMRTGPHWLFLVVIIDNILETGLFMLLFKSAAVVFSIWLKCSALPDLHKHAAAHAVVHGCFYDNWKTLGSTLVKAVEKCPNRIYTVVVLGKIHCRSLQSLSATHLYYLLI